jgi:hypothetical protein
MPLGASRWVGSLACHPQNELRNLGFLCMGAVAYLSIGAVGDLIDHAPPAIAGFAVARLGIPGAKPRQSPR